MAKVVGKRGDKDRDRERPKAGKGAERVLEAMEKVDNIMVKYKKI